MAANSAIEWTSFSPPLGLRGGRGELGQEYIKRQCQEQHAAFFFKQWGGWGADGRKRPKKRNGRLLEGRTWDGVPEVGAIVGG